MCNIMIYLLIFTWLKMASLCKSAFDEDDGVDYDLKLGMVTKKSIVTIFGHNIEAISDYNRLIDI